MSTNEDILDIHERCLNYLIEEHNQDKTLLFVPRITNKYNRLDKHYFFIGNDEYLMITFWKGGDSTEKIHNINFRILENGKSSIQINARDNSNKAKELELLVNHLRHATNKKYEKCKDDMWIYDYTDDSKKNIYYLDALKSFIRYEKKIIDEYLLKNSINGIESLNEETFKRYIDNLIPDLSKEPNDSPDKTTEPVYVSVAGHIKNRDHNHLQNNLKAYLNNSNEYKKIVLEKEYVDITAINKLNEKILFEIKTSGVKLAIRSAVGQLLEYNHYKKEQKATKLIVVTKFSPSKSDVQYLKKLRQIYQIPIYYQQFDMEKKLLKNEF